MRLLLLVRRFVRIWTQDLAHPDYWSKIRDQFMLAPDNVFFNPATVGAMPKVVIERKVDHLRAVGTDVTDWAYQDVSREAFISGTATCWVSARRPGLSPA